MKVTEPRHPPAPVGVAYLALGGAPLDGQLLLQAPALLLQPAEFSLVVGNLGFRILLPGAEAVQIFSVAEELLLLVLQLDVQPLRRTEEKKKTS